MPRKIKGMSQISPGDLAAIHSIARSAIGVAGITHDELDDLEQELTLKLIRKTHLFRRRIQSWGTFRRAVLTRCLSDIIESRNKPRYRQIYLEHRSLDDSLPNYSVDGDDFATLGDMVTTEGLISDNTEKPELPGLGLKIDIEIFIASLSPYQRQVCGILKTRNPTDAAKVLKIHRVHLYRIISEIKIGMKKAGFDAYI